MSQPIVAAHRGLSAKHPENTLVAFQAAVEAGFSALEFDVRVTHDKIPIVMHDANIARTTDGVGRVSDFDWDELRSHHTAAGPIPTLEEALRCVPDWSGVWNMEVKAAKAVEPAVRVIEELGLTGRVILTAMDPDALTRAKNAEPALRRGLITLGRPDLDDLEAAEATDCDWMMVDYAFITEAVAHQCHAAGMLLGAWTVNDVDEASHLATLADMIITDTDDVLKAITG